VAVVIVIMVVIMIVVAALTRLFQIMALLFRLPAMLAVPAYGFFQILFRFVDPPLAFFIIAIQRPRRNRTGDEAEGDESCNQKFGPQ
jgi:hypothetical protein